MEFGVGRLCSPPDAFQEHPGIRRDLRVVGLPEGFQRRGPTGERGLGCGGSSPIVWSCSDVTFRQEEPAKLLGKGAVITWGATETMDLCAGSSRVLSVLRQHPRHAVGVP